MASNLEAMASNLYTSDGLQPSSNGSKNHAALKRPGLEGRYPEIA